MASKKRVKRKNVVMRKSSSKKVVRSNIRKISLVSKNLITFVILFVVSLVLYSASSSNSIYENLFAILTMIFGFVSLAFLIVFLIFVFMKMLKK